MDDFTMEKSTITPNEESEKTFWPEFLFTPIFNEFEEDDGFYQRVEESYDGIEKVLRLKRKYRDFFKWRDAMDIYQDYMDYLEDKYGSVDIIMNSIEEGYPIEDYIPPKPQLKKNPTNKQIMKTGIIPARRIITQMDEDLILEVDADLYGNDPNRNNEVVYVKPPKKQLRSFQKAIDHSESVNRVNNVKRKHSSDNGTDIVTNYWNDLMKKKYDDYGKPQPQLSIAKLTEEYEQESYADPEIEAYERSLAENPIVYVSGSGIKRERYEQIEIMKALMKEGYNIEALSGGSKMDKAAVKMIKSQLRIDDVPSTEDMRHMTKKQRKKAMKKMRKKSREAYESDRRIDELLSANKIHHGSDNVKFAINNLFRD